jgi:hypothetical protein
MSIGTPLAISKKSDPQTVRGWAAEHFAISIGLLRECPYHGHPFKVRSRAGRVTRLPLALVDPHDPFVRAFNGNARELYDAARRISGNFGDCCPLCAASEQEEFD